ncbi:CopG family transcriptional regulator [Cyanobacterium aponinum]|uniref:CopG family transcriptional regulator n=1 Tax=Cyanobacterium aponinum 0216 TaxID=2676140 RepID=A0A844GWW7_9CHRO|nr:CopG family transcriptional regulator [Cyanobacterium aponinum]MTF40680.1 CopG family transcriptional regulator [Cyanobacterium aponinum 0216]
MLEINTKLTEKTADKLAYIQTQTQEEINQILELAIDNYYQKIKGKQKTSLELLEESGLIGCISAEPDLSTNYKSVIGEGLESKYDHC